tara:strand:- start:15 stop:131 length:117 start_codon:yes stop_codon:yes gene_type:complete
MKVKINQNELFWVQMLMDKFGLTKEQAVEKLKNKKNER